MSAQDGIRRSSFPSIVLICLYSSFLLALVETAYCVAGGWRVPWHVAVGLYLFEMALGFVLFLLLAAGGLLVSKLFARQPSSLAVAAILLGFPLLFGFHWLIGVDTPAMRYRNLLLFAVIGATLSLVWIVLALRRKDDRDTIGWQACAFMFLFPLSSLGCFDLYLRIEQTDAYFSLFYVGYTLFFIVAGELALRPEQRTSEETRLPIKIAHAVAAILVAALALAIASQIKTAFVDTAPKYEARQGEAGEGPNVILISLDTLRADHLSCYGYSEKTSPNIDRLASRGARFEHAIAQAPWTLPSHSSLFTSRYPHQLENHAVGKNISLPELLKKRGYTTVAFTGGDFVSKSVYGRHFDLFDDEGEQIYRLRQSHSLVMSLLHLRRFGRRFGLSFRPLNIVNHWRFWRPERAVARASFAAQRENASEWLREHGGKNRFFLFLHTYSVHDYFLNRSTARENAKQFNPGYSGILDGVNLDYHSDYPERREDADQIRALYDGEILDADREVGRLIEDLRALELWDNTIIILLSDHGEGFEKELDRLWHGYRLNDDLLRVPLVIVYPPQIPAGRIVRSQVALLDVMPTVLDILGIECPSDIEGISLKPLMMDEGSDPGERFIYSEVAGWDATGVSLRSNGRKYIVYPDRTEFYDLKADPRETANLVDKQPPEMQAVQPLIDAFSSKARKGVVYDKETIDKMKAVGYLQ